MTSKLRQLIHDVITKKGADIEYAGSYAEIWHDIVETVLKEAATNKTKSIGTPMGFEHF